MSQQQITDADIRRQVTAAVTSNGADLAEGIDIEGVVREIIDTYGLVNIEGWDPVTGNELVGFDEFWAIVRKHDSTQAEG